MTIDGNGNVGIGPTSPAEKLDVNGNIKFNGKLYIDGSTASGTRSVAVEVLQQLAKIIH